MKTTLRVCIFLGSIGAIAVGRSFGEGAATPESLSPFTGIYQSKSGGITSITTFDPGDGEYRLLFTDLGSGVIRVLAPVSENVFSAGPGLLVPTPTEMQFTFERNGTEPARSFAIRKEGAGEETATKIPTINEEVAFKNGDTSLAATLISPANPHGAVVFLHGSGPLNRYSFGPFPDLFVSHGFAVLVYDKRGTGKSKGNLDSSTLDDLAADGRAAVRFLKERTHLKEGRIGLSGASQGGFLAAAVAASNPDVAFLVNLYGMYVPVWQQELYRSEAEMRADGIGAADIDEGLAFVKKEFEVAKTGKDWESLAKTISQSKEKKWWRHVTKSDSLDELRHYWQTLYSYDPARPLEKVTCPVLAVFGELDTSTPVPQSIENMRRALAIAHNSDFTSKVFPKTGHGLLESETGASSEIPKARRLAPGFCDLMATWLEKKQPH